ncbi:MAG TPA: glycosyltransferase, partial [Candidatus Krumholzibacteria bacterium]|nr:glycosyltransferase [Candidatus Krumholzibacteria bacterium]
RYGFDTIVQAVAVAKDRVPGIQFRFMGTGDYLGDVMRLAASLNVRDRVHHLGFVPFEQMIEEILLADACVVAVKASPYSVLVHTNKMYEYMALERPIIASRLGSVAAYAPDEAVLYFEPGNAMDLAEKLVWAVSHPDDMARRVARASAVYERLRWERAKQSYLGGYRDVPAEKSSKEPG